MFWSCESLTCLLISLHAVISTMLEFFFLRDFAGDVAPGSFLGTVTTSFIGRKFDFYLVLLFQRVLPALPKF